MDNIKDVFLTCRLDSKTKEAFKKLAKSQYMKPSQLVYKLICKEIEKNK